MKKTLAELHKCRKAEELKNLPYKNWTGAELLLTPIFFDKTTTNEFNDWRIGKRDTEVFGQEQINFG